MNHEICFYFVWWPDFLGYLFQANFQCLSMNWVFAGPFETTMKQGQATCGLGECNLLLMHGTPWSWSFCWHCLQTCSLLPLPHTELSSHLQVVLRFIQVKSSPCSVSGLSHRFSIARREGECGRCFHCSLLPLLKNKMPLVLSSFFVWSEGGGIRKSLMSLTHQYCYDLVSIFGAVGSGEMGGSFRALDFRADLLWPLALCHS